MGSMSFSFTSGNFILRLKGALSHDRLDSSGVLMFRITAQVIILGAACQFFAARCSGEDYELIKQGRMLEFALNDTYAQAVHNARLSKNLQEVENLKDAESKWRAYRDAECRAEADENVCLVNMTKQRIEALKALYFKVAANPPELTK